MSLCKWNLLIVFMLAVCAIGVPAFNVVTDPYGVFHMGWKHDSPAFDERYLKVEHLIEHPGKHNAFILGSSMMGAFDPVVMNIATPGLSWYNLSFLGGTPKESLDALTALSRRGIIPKQVLVGIDFFPFRQDSAGEDSPSRYPHPLVTGEHPLLWYRHFLFASSFWTGALRVIGEHSALPDIHFDIEGGGRYRLVKQENEMAADPAGYAKRHLPHAEDAKAGGSEVAWVEGRFEDLAILVAWLKAHNVEARYFIHPFNHRLLDSVSKRSMGAFRARIQSITGPLADFSKDDGITRDDLNYFDTKHYTQKVANTIVAQMLGDEVNPKAGGVVALNAAHLAKQAFTLH